MSSEQDLLYPAFQKFYSALNSLERFHKEKSFFENISSLDTFFSEFKSIVETMEYILQNTPYDSWRKAQKSRVWNEFSWFFKIRDGVIHRHPFKLSKKIAITAYLPGCRLDIYNKEFSISDDQPLASVIDDAKNFLDKIDSVEVFFSARFSFYKQDTSEDIFAKIPQGVKAMYDFLAEFYAQFPEKNQAIEELLKLIKKHSIICVPQDMILVNDYVYYPAENEFEMIGRCGFTTNYSFGGKSIPRTPLKNFHHWYKKLGKNDFERFVAMHVMMRTRQEIFPAFMLIFQDDTYEIDAWDADNKTTLYRKINETAQQILREDVKEVLFEYSMISIPDKPEILDMYAKDRQKLAEEEWLVLLKVDDQLNEEEYSFHVPGLKCSGYIANKIKAGSNKKLLFGAINMLPIIQAFKQKKEKSAQAE